MMKPDEIRREAVLMTLKLIDEPPENWMTFNDSMHTYIIDDVHRMKSNVHLNQDEVPILECVLENSFVIITTERLISKFHDQYGEMKLRDVKEFSNEVEKANYERINGRPQKTHLIIVRSNDNKELCFKIDSHHPAYFARVLIRNLVSYLTQGRWFWNPKLRG